MERDAHLRFKDIYDSPKAMLASAEHIQRLALYREGSNWPLLRFLTLLEPQPKRAIRSSEIYLSLTPRNRALENYVAVSYTWTRSDPVPKSIPQYRIVNPLGKVIKPSKELNYVVHRAWTFAMRHEISFLWIDQLCIKQDDPEDVESHLQCMHQVFAQSTITFAPLSMSLNEKTLGTLECFLESTYPRVVREAEELGDTYSQLFDWIIKDRWFHRTWCYQERYCGRSVMLAFHTPPPVSKRAGKGEVSAETYISIPDIEVAFAKFQTAVPYPPIHTEANRSRKSLEHVMRLYFDCPRSPNVAEEREYLETRHVFDVIEICNNTIVPDRLAILANIRKYEYRLKTTLLNNPRLSYSTSVLVLVLTNSYFTFETDLKRHYFLLSMNATVKQVIESLEGGPPLYPGTTEDNKPIYVVEDSEIQWQENYVQIPVLTPEELERLAFTIKRSQGKGPQWEDDHEELGLTRRLARSEAHMTVSGDIGRWIRETREREIRASEQEDQDIVK